jgi:Cu(I)/Ag(I) efflux system membrane protein CusA/SilA
MRTFAAQGPGEVFKGNRVDQAVPDADTFFARRSLTYTYPMVERIIEFSIRRRWLVIAAAGVLAVAGIAAVVNTPVDATPDLSENQVIVFTPWEGHEPQEIEDQVTFPLSLELQGLPGVRVVRGSSEVGFSMIHVIFEDGIQVEAGRREVAQRLACHPA